MPLKSKTLVITKQGSVKKSNINNQKAAKMRRQRGYHWEDTIVKRFNNTTEWRAFRLGSPSIALPDVLAVNNENEELFTIEAKSGTSTSLPVPADQIESQDVLECSNKNLVVPLVFLLLFQTVCYLNIMII